jgi:hypothetical protein
VRKFAHYLCTTARYALCVIIFAGQTITFSQIDKNQHSPSGGPRTNHVKGKCHGARAVTGYYFQARKVGKGKYVLSRRYRPSGITNKCLCWEGPVKSMADFSLFSLDTNHIKITRDSVISFKNVTTPACVGIKHGTAMVPDTIVIAKISFKLVNLQKVWYDSIPKLNSDW